MEDQLGTFVIGKYLGTTRRAWRNDPNKFNHYIAVTDFEWEDDYGQQKSREREIELPYQQEERVKFECEKFKAGDIVRIHVTPDAKQGRSGPFLVMRMLKDTSVEAYSAPKMKAAS